VEKRAGVDPADVRAEFDRVLGEVCAAATLVVQPLVPAHCSPGRDGMHTEAMGPLLAELQGVARADGDATW
jgi:ring-1,2-phenylacetyl-CoA epoxidase subunit PaaC